MAEPGPPPDVADGDQPGGTKGKWWPVPLRGVEADGLSAGARDALEPVMRRASAVVGALERAASPDVRDISENEVGSLLATPSSTQTAVSRVQL